MVNLVKYKELNDFCEDRQVELVAVSKTKPINQIMELYRLGHRSFGENKVQELMSKAEQLPEDIKWHMIGHLQTNKVKYITQFVHLIHSVDRLSLVKEIQKQAKKIGKKVQVLLQVKIAEEDTKFGWEVDTLINWLDKGEHKKYDALHFKGCMGMATFTDNTNQVRKEFELLKQTFDNIQKSYFDDEFNIISMGMSGDYPIAISCGSNMVRIGSLLFGARN